jgi:hypothetical protein
MTNFEPSIRGITFSYCYFLLSSRKFLSSLFTNLLNLQLGIVRDLVIVNYIKHQVEVATGDQRLVLSPRVIIEADR